MTMDWRREMGVQVWTLGLCLGTFRCALQYLDFITCKMRHLGSSYCFFSLLLFVFSMLTCSHSDFSWQALLINHPLFPAAPGWCPRILLTWPSRKSPPVQWCWHWRWSACHPRTWRSHFIPKCHNSLKWEIITSLGQIADSQRRASWSLLGLSHRHLGSRFSFQATNWGVVKSHSHSL